MLDSAVSWFVQARLTSLAPGARVVLIACLLLACPALGQSLIDSIRFPCPAPLPGGRHSLAYDHNDRLLYLGGTGCESLFVVDDRRGAVVGAIRLEGRVTDVCYSPLVNRVYCGTEAEGVVHVIEPVANHVLHRISVDADIRALSLDMAGNRLFCVTGSGTVSVVDCATNMVENSIGLTDSFGINVATCYVPQLRRLYVAAEQDSVLFALDCERESLLATIGVEHQPNALCYNPANGRLYSAGRDDTTLKALDPTSNTVVASLPGARGTEWLCSNPASNKVYALGGSGMSVYDGRADSLLTAIDLGAEECMSLVWDSRHNVVYTTGSSW